MDNHAIYWLKRDFRLADNPALTAALEENDRVTPLFILEPSFLTAPETSAFHVHAVHNALEDLNRRLALCKAEISIARGEVPAVLEMMYDKQPFTAIYSHEEIGIERTYARDRAVSDWCRLKGVTWHEFAQTGVFRRLPDRDVRKKLWRAFTFAELLPSPQRAVYDKLKVPQQWQEIFQALPDDYREWAQDTPFEEVPREQLQKVSESAALTTLQDFLYHRGIAYRGGISSPLTAFTAGSRLSVHLAWGTITGRSIYQATQKRKLDLKESDHPQAGKFRSSLTSFLSRLHWRDHFIQRLETEPQMEFVPLHPAYAELEYRNDPEHLAAWTAGRTGYPMVDACIHCLQATGFINFRMRAMLTSFACHSLQIDWRLIDHPMARMYTDYEPGIHLSQLQMQASVVGINTIRIYSPDKQLTDHDPDLVFTKQWIPELRNLSNGQISGYREESLPGYPEPLVDWRASSSEMRTKLWTIRKREDTKEKARRVYQKHGSRKGPMKRRKRAAEKVKNEEE